MKREFWFPACMLLLIEFLFLGFSGVAFADDGISRSFLKMGSALAAILGIVGIAVAGYFAGKSYDSHTGWERYQHGAGQFYNRKPFRRDSPTYGVTDQPKRLNWEENLFARLIKKIAHTFRATLVGITKLNPDWCYQGLLRGVGPGNYDVPAHWEYATYHEPPDWLQTDKWFDIPKTW